MEKEFIPYEQALALKELGFDEPCLTYYNYDKKIERSDDWAYGCTLEDKRDRNECLAPLKQQAFRWFREKYGLHRHICYFNDTNVWHGDLYKLANGGLMNAPMELTGYKTYEEAELGCLKKLIQIIKNK